MVQVVICVLLLATESEIISVDLALDFRNDNSTVLF